MNNTRSKTKSTSEPLLLLKQRRIIALVFAMLICIILFFTILPLFNEKANTLVDEAVPQVEEYIRRHTLKGSEALEIIHWSKLVKRTALDMLSYRVGVVYKIKYPNGKFRMESKVFDLDKNKNVMFEMNVPPFENM